MRFALIDQIGIGGELQRIAEGSQRWAAEVAADWLCAAASVRISSGHDLDPALECPIYLQRSIDVQGAAAYHDEDPIGNRYIRCALDAVPGHELLRGPRGDGASLLGLVQHEVGEAMIDPTADVWRQQPFHDRRSGRTYNLVAQEICDPVQEIADTLELADGARVDRIAWVSPGWFDSRRSSCAPVDSHGALSEPLTLAPGGYQIAAKVTGEASLFADVIEHPERGLARWRLAAKRRPSSRTVRRLAAFGGVLEAVGE